MPPYGGRQHRIVPRAAAGEPLEPSYYSSTGCGVPGQCQVFAAARYAWSEMDTLHQEDPGSSFFVEERKKNAKEAVGKLIRT